MSERDDFERRVESWLLDTARPMPQELFNDIVATAQRLPRPGVRAEFPSGRRWQLAIATIGAAIVFVVGLGIATRLPPGTDSGSTPGLVSQQASQALSSPTPSLAPPPASSPSSGPPSPSPSTPILGEWHRNNYNAGEERLFCTETTPSWTCRYQVDNGTGWFSGQNITASWSCPGWFPPAICDNATAVYQGRLVLVAPEGQTPGPGSVVSQEYVVTEVEGQMVLQLAWVDEFVCPWYRTYEEALAADFVCWFAP